MSCYHCDELREENKKLQSKLSEQATIIRDLRKHLKWTLENDERYGCDCHAPWSKGREKCERCKAQHCLSYTSGYDEK